MENRDIFSARLEDLAGRAKQTGCAASRFLTPAEAAAAETHFARRNDIRLCLDGGYAGAERKRAIFLAPDWGAYEREDLFAALQISCREQDALRHRDILGALMALGMERDTLGDILAEAKPAALICLPELSGYILENFSKAGRVGLSLCRIPLQELPNRTENLTIKTATVASLRLDALLAAAFGLSRARAAELISAGLVSLNHEPCLQPAKEAGEGSLLSVRGLGRARMLETGGASRKGRIFIKIGLYGK